jgi:hypothetical protein
MKHIILCLALLLAILASGCSSTPTTTTTTPHSTPVLPVQTVLNLGIMVHLEGWNDGNDEASFRRHAELLREYAALFEKYGAKLTLESKEMTDGCINWGDNVLLEMQERGHAVAIHADVGGSKADTVASMISNLTTMKSSLQSLDIDFRHVSGIVSHCDWVKACIDTGFKFVTGVVSYALLSLPPEIRPITIPDNATPSQFHQSYPFSTEGQLFAWRMKSGADWIYDNPSGKLVIMPSGGGLANAYEDSQGLSGGSQNFTPQDIDAFEQELQEILAYISTSKPTQPCTYYLSWSFGKALDKTLLEAWLKMVDKYVDAGQVQWQTIPQMYDKYVQWEIDSGRH